MDEKKELKERVAAKQKELEAKLHELKADGSEKAAEQKDKIEAKLDELKEKTSTGWDSMSASVANQLNSWLKKN